VSASPQAWHVVFATLWALRAAFRVHVARRAAQSSNFAAVTVERNGVHVVDSVPSRHPQNAEKQSKGSMHAQRTLSVNKPTLSPVLWQDPKVGIGVAGIDVVDGTGLVDVVDAGGIVDVVDAGGIVVDDAGAIDVVDDAGGIVVDDGTEVVVDGGSVVLIKVLVGVAVEVLWFIAAV
jgi:hypothetical protein